MKKMRKFKLETLVSDFKFLSLM